MVGGISNNSYVTGMSPAPKPDPKVIAEKIFAKLDIKNQGYITEADLTSTAKQLNQSVSTIDVQKAFKSLDTTGDGKVTKGEFEDDFKKAMDSLQSQMAQMRQIGKEGMPPPMGIMGGGKPPPPPPPPSSGGKSESSSDASNTTDSASSVKALIASVIQPADTDGNGKVSGAEQIKYDTKQVSGTSISQSSSAQSTTKAANAYRAISQI